MQVIKISDNVFDLFDGARFVSRVHSQEALDSILFGGKNSVADDVPAPRLEPELEAAAQANIFSREPSDSERIVAEIDAMPDSEKKGILARFGSLFK